MRNWWLWCLAICNLSNNKWNFTHCTLLLQEALQAVPSMFVLPAATLNSPLHRQGFGGGVGHLSCTGPNKRNTETSNEVNRCCCCKSSTPLVAKIKTSLLHICLALKYSNAFFILTLTDYICYANVTCCISLSKSLRQKACITSPGTGFMFILHEHWQ